MSTRAYFSRDKPFRVWRLNATIGPKASEKVELLRLLHEEHPPKQLNSHLADNLLQLASAPFSGLGGKRRRRRLKKIAESLHSSIQGWGAAGSPEDVVKLSESSGLLATLTIQELPQNCHVIIEPELDLGTPKHFDYALGSLIEDEYIVHCLAEIKRLTSTSNLDHYVGGFAEDVTMLSEVFTYGAHPPDFILHLHLAGKLAGSKQVLGALHALRALATVLRPKFHVIITSANTNTTYFDYLNQVRKPLNEIWSKRLRIGRPSP